MSVSDFTTPGNAPRTPQPLPSPERGLALWWCGLVRDASDLPAMWAALSPEEVARAERFGTDALRHRYVAGRWALRWTLAQRLGVEPAAVPIRRGARGRPMLDEGRAPDFNVTHTLGVALIAHLDRPGWRVGVDIEGVDRTLSHDGLARKFLTDRERAAIAVRDDDGRRRAFLRLWTCKEAMSKATGDALSAPFRKLDVAVAPIPALAAGPAPYTPGQWRLLPVDVPGGYFTTVAVWHEPHSP